MRGALALSLYSAHGTALFISVPSVYGTCVI